MTTPIIIVGGFGRMGRAVVAAASANSHFSVQGVVKRSDSAQNKAQDLPFFVYDNLESALQKSSGVVIDFSSTASLSYHVATAKRFGAGILIATTGHNQQDRELILEASRSIPVVVAPNTSLMANLMLCCCELIASSLSDFSASVLDIHHAQKKDAPSGTAKALLNAIKNSPNCSEVSVHSMRHGTVVGDHTAYFFNQFERLEITHRVTDRHVFAEGALLAAQFLFNQAPGLYDMRDVINNRMIIKNEAK